jgi:hypothetical protein
MAVPIEVEVGFAGSRGGSCPLSWGQAAIWGAIRRLAPNDAALNMGWITAIEQEGISRDTPLSRVEDALRQVVVRHESLRTLFPLDAQGEPYQLLCQIGTVPIEVADAGEAQAAQEAAAMRERMLSAAFAYGTELPLRVGVVQVNGFVTHAVFVVSHLATDRGGLNALVRDVVDGLGGKPLPELTALQPYDQARHQCSQAGRRQSERALRYWERQLLGVPMSRFPSVGEASKPRYWNGILRSPAMDKAVSLIAARQRVSSAAVLLAAAAFGLTRFTGADTAVLQIIVGNRFRSGLAESVCPSAQDGICVVPVGESTFEQVVQRSAKASMSTYLNSQYDPAALENMLAKVAAVRGGEVDLSCSFNDRRFDAQTPPGAVATGDEVRAALPATTFHWDPPLEKYGARYFLHIDGVSGAIQLCLFADTTVMAPKAIEDYLRDLESVTVRSALADS